MVYSVEKQRGLRWMQDRNGNQVNVSPAGVTHSSGKGIAFERDGAGRIVKVTDPMDRGPLYEYVLASALTSYRIPELRW
jgi:YD repeat-containing protein